MISDRLVQLLESQAERLTNSWVELLRSNENTQTYGVIDDAILIKRIHDVYRKLHLWLDWGVSSEDVARYFMLIGQERQEQDIPLCAVCYAVILARRNLYIHIMEESVPRDSLEMQQVNEFNSRITYFFDKAIYFIIKGYEGKHQQIIEEEGMLSRILQAFKTGTSLSTPD